MFDTDFNLDGKLALVTGGGTGIGFGIASKFIEAGARVIIIGRREHVLKEAIQKLGKNAFYRVMDITKLDEIPNFVANIQSAHGTVDVLVNNAGKHLKAHAFDTSDEEFSSVLQTNLISVFSLSREIAKNMKQHNTAGSILMISSMTAIMGMDRVVAYSTAKTGILGMMRAMVADFSRYDIRVNAIAPGWIESDMLHQALDGDPERKAKVMGRIPLDHLGEPEDVSKAALFLASDAAKYISGVLLPVDGGAATSF